MPWLQLLMPLSAAVLIIAILCSGAFLHTTWKNYKLYKIVLLVLSPRLPDTHTYLQFVRSCIGSLFNIAVFFKTALLVYKFIHSGTPDYFTPYLKPKKFTYMTRSSQSDGIILDVPLRTSYHPTNHQNSLVTASALMPLRSGMTFQMMSVLPPHSHLSDASQKHTFSSKHTLHNHSPFPTVSVVPKYAMPLDIWDLPMA